MATEELGWVVVTGVSRGLGAEICARLLRQNNRVIGFSRSITDSLQSMQEEHGDRFQHVTLDLSDARAIKTALAENVGASKIIHALVNNAAVAYDDLVTNLRTEELESMFQVNVFAAMQFSKHCIRNMLLHRTRGSLVHVSSISTHQGYKGLSMYAATKGALEAFSKNVAREWGSQGIRSNCVVPGFMETEMSQSLDAEERAKIYRRTALRSATKIASVSQTVEFLLGEASESITGQNVVVDSGTT